MINSKEQETGNRQITGKTPAAFNILGWAEKGICYGCLLLLALLPFTEMLLRFFRVTIPASETILKHFFLVLGFFAAMITAKSGEHITISVIQYVKNDKVKRIFEFFCTFLSVFILIILAWNCVSYIKYGLVGIKVGSLPVQAFAVAMPLGYAVVALRHSLRLPQKRERVIALTAILLGTIAALPAVAKIIWGFEPPEPFFSWVNTLYDLALLIRLPVILFLILAAFLGTPLFVVIGGIAMIALQASGLEPEAAPIQIFSALTKVEIIAIPLFTLTGFFLSESNAGRRLVNVFRLFIGWLPGGMIITTVLICAFFTSFTWASGVTILALGGILYKILNEDGYTERFSIGLLTSAGGVGLMFPPSLPIILIAVTSSTTLYFMNERSPYSFVHFFAGGIIPGIILVAAMIIAGIVLSSKVKVPKEPFEPKKALRSLKESALEILLPIILILGYFSGRFTLMEVSAVSVIYVIIVEVFIKKDISFAGIPRVFSKAVPIIGGVLAILAMAQALSYTIIDSGVPEHFALWMQAAVQSKYVFLLLLNLALLVVGCLMDIFSAIMVVLPLIVPLGHIYGIDPVHLGIIFVINLEAGFLTPPVGMNLFLASYRFEKPFVQICRYVLPYLVIRLVVVLLVTYIPWLSTWLVGFFN
jgi:tripartite ATP-independent transporter DctM subunit